MKFSLNMAEYYSNVELKALPKDDIVSRMGLQLGAIEDVVEWAPKYKGIYVVKAIECKKHPNADKLSLCRIDDGGITQHVKRDDDGMIQVVCGAPNARAGMYAVWIPPEATLPSSLETDPLILEAREIRGEFSNGMLASPSELGISDNHDGILEIDKAEVEREPQAGESFSSFYGLDDLIVVCENKMFTHRPDCFGNLGIARELAGIFGLKFQSPDWYLNNPEFEVESAERLPLQVKNDIADLVPRFTVVAMDGVEVKPSPMWLQAYLRRIGIKPINNVVDITNFVMHLTGQPLHAFDYDKLQKYSDKPSLLPRMAQKGEKVKLLGGKTITLDEQDIVIATDKQAVALAGIMGGADTEVDESTKSIVIECANFDMYAVRRSSMRHGLFTEAVTRFNKGQSPLQNAKVLAYAMKKMSEIANAKPASQVYDLAGFDVSADNLNHVSLSSDFINSRLGVDLSVEAVRQLLENVEFVVKTEGKTLHITAPFWRMDIAIAEDVVEEIGRLYGYDKVPVVLPARSAEPTPKNAIREHQMHLRYLLKESGANEVLTYSFVHGDLLKACGVDAESAAYHLRNALSPDLQHYRPIILPSLLAKVHSNLKAQAGSVNNAIALFEIGKAHIKGDMEAEESNLPRQQRHLAFVLAADDKTAKGFGGSAYFHVRQYIDELTNHQAVYSPLEDFTSTQTAAYKKGRSAFVSVGDRQLGVIGELNNKATNKLKLPKYCAGFELDIDGLRESVPTNAYQQQSAFPSITADITLEVKQDQSWSEVNNFIEAELAVAAAEDNLIIKLEPLSIFVPDKKSKRLSFRVVCSHYQKTLKTEEVDKMLEHVAEAAGEKFGAKRI